MSSDKDKKSRLDVLNNRENSDGESIYGQFRRKILDDQSREVVDKVQGGAQSGYSFEDTGEEDTLSGEYVKKTDKKTVALYVIISTIILTSLIFFIYSLIPDPEDKFLKYKNLIAEVEKLNVKKSKKVKEIEKIVKELRENEEYEDIEVDPSSEKILTDESIRFLSDQASKEEDEDIQSKISTIIKTDKELKDLQKDIIAKNKGLEPPVVMTRSKGHAKIAYDFLTKKQGLGPKDAKDIVESVNIFDYTYEGLYVWNFYEKGFYGSFVTKGEADKTPNEIKKLAQQAFQDRILDLEEERTNLKNITKQLETELKSSQAKVEQLLSERDKLGELDSKNRQLQIEMMKKQEMISDLNSVKYKLVVYDFAIDRGIITESVWDGVKLGRTTDVDFSSKVDFSVTDNLIIRPKQFGLDSFEEVYVLPKSYISSGDIRILKRDQICKIEFTNKQNLVQKEILIIAK